MRKSLLVVSAALFFVLVLAVSAPALVGDPLVGIWKMNPAKSKYNPGPAPRRQKLKIAAQNNGFRYVIDTVEANGKSTHLEWTAKYDGKDYPVSGLADVALMLRRIDAHTVEQVVKRAGKEVGIRRQIVSANGKTMTATRKGTNAKGQDSDDTAVYDKQ